MKYLLSPLWASVTILLLTWLTLSNPTFLQNIELKLFDQLIVREKIVADDVVLIDISEDTLKKHGQYPFPRNVYGDLIQRLREANAGVIAFNISFPEQDRTGQDGMFKEQLNQGVVISHFPSEKTEGRSAYTSGVVEVGFPAWPYIPTYKGIAANIAEYEALANGIGIANTLPELDGVVRRLPMMSNVGDVYYPSMILEILKVYMGTNTYQIKSNEFGVEAVRVKGYDTINTDEMGRIWINPNYTFKRFNLDDAFPDLNGATVFVGLTAEGLSNPVPTAAGATYGHEISARAFESITQGYNISTPQEAMLYKLGAVVLIGALIIGTSYIRFGWLPPLLLIAGAVYLPSYMFTNYFILINTAISGALSVLIFAHVYGVKYGQEYFAKMQIKKQFGTYLSPAMVEKLQKNPELLKLGGETRELSIMFTDVRGFTSISEHYGEDVQGLTKIMNRYMTAMTGKILENAGTLDKYIGDAQMAFWNAPLDDPEHAKNAVRTGLAMLGDLDAFNEEIAKEGVPAFGMGLGINTASVVVGNMGSDQRFDYTCLGDGVNLASRLEGQSKPYGVKIIVGPLTAEQIKDEFQVVELDLIAVKGKTEPVKIFTVLSHMCDDVKYWSRHSDFLNDYRMGDFTSAKVILNHILDICPKETKHYYEAMLERVDSLLKNPPQKWDGVFRATSK